MRNEEEFGVLVENEDSGKKFEEFGVLADETPSNRGKKIARDVAKQIPTSAAKGGLGSWGNLLSFLGLQSEENENLPGQESRYNAQSEILDKMNRGERPSLGELMLLGDDDVAADFSRLPTSENIGEFFESLGIEPEAETAPGRVVGKGVEGLAGAASMGAGGPLSLLAGLGSAAGEGARELGLPEWLAVATDLGISLSPSLKGVGKAAKALKGSPQKTESGISKLKGLGKKPKKPIPVSEKKFAKTSDLIKSDFKSEIERLTDKNLPFSRIAKSDPRTYSRFSKAFNSLSEQAKRIPGEKFGGEKLFETIDQAIKKTRKLPYKSGESKGYIKEMNSFRKALAGKKLSASDWEKQYREINKGIRNLSSSLDVKGDKAGKLKALNELRGLTEKSIISNFKDHPEFVKSFESLNKAYSDLKNFESVNKLFDSSLSTKYFSPDKVIKKINSPKGEKILLKALGKDGYKEVQKLSTDLNDVKDLFKTLKVKNGDWKALSKQLKTHIPVAALSMIFPKGAIPAEIAILGKEGVGQTRKILNNMLLSAQGRRNWGEIKKAISSHDPKAFAVAASKLKKGKGPSSVDGEEEDFGFLVEG